MPLLHNRYSQVLTAALLLQAGAYYAIASRPEHLPGTAPLGLFAATVGRWQSVREIAIEPEVLQVLKADDTLNRWYADPSQPQSQPVNLFIAFFKTQRAGQAPHSPKNCLPGSGWEPIQSGMDSIKVPGRGTPIVINRYVVQHGDEKSVTLYWYQSHNRVIAGELADKFWLVADAIRYRRSDTALIRISVPVREDDVDAAARAGVGFVQSLFPYLLRQLPA